MADLSTEKILATDFSNGSQHDFQLFKQSRYAVAQQTCILADAGYQGLANLHLNSQTPVKKTYPDRKHYSQVKDLSNFERTLSQPA